MHPATQRTPAIARVPAGPRPRPPPFPGASPPPLPSTRIPPPRTTTTTSAFPPPAPPASGGLSHVHLAPAWDEDRAAHSLRGGSPGQRLSRHPQLRPSNRTAVAPSRSPPYRGLSQLATQRGRVRAPKGESQSVSRKVGRALSKSEFYISLSRRPMPTGPWAGKSPATTLGALSASRGLPRANLSDASARQL